MSAAVGKRGVAIAVERGAVEHRAGRFVVVQIDREHVDRAALRRIGDESGRVHLAAPQLVGIVGQAKPVAAGGDHLRVELDRSGARLEPLVRRTA